MLRPVAFLTPALLSSFAAAQEPLWFQPLGFAPAAVSGDGRVVVGTRGQWPSNDARAFRWSRDQGTTMIWPGIRSTAWDVSFDGTRIVGAAPGLALYTEGHGTLHLDAAVFRAWLSRDGRTILGNSTSAGKGRIYGWHDQGRSGIEEREIGDEWSLLAVSPDCDFSIRQVHNQWGTLIVRSGNGCPQEPFRYLNGYPSALTAAPFTAVGSRPDGTVLAQVVGCSGPAPEVPLRITMPGHAYLVTPDARFVVTDDRIWTTGGLAADTRTLLLQTGAHLSPAPLGVHAISGDGRVIAGTGAGYTGWVARIRPPCYANCDASTHAPALSVADFNCFLDRYRAGDPRANCDGSTEPPTLTPADLQCFMTLYTRGCP
jgi:hypothetical protein